MAMHHHNGHDHRDGSSAHAHLTSVGIDIGSSTSHLMFSELRIGYPSPHQRKPQVLERRVIARSPVLFTPFAGDWNIRADPLRELIDLTFQQAGLRREQIDTGAVIITGEAARRSNAAKIARLFSEDSGRFVCATAGPTLETLMAAHGSGAVLKSREAGSTIMNIDVGGGTTKISIVESGRVTDTMAVNIGARLIAHDGSGTVTRLEKAGRCVLEDLGCRLDIGDKVDENLRARLAERMARALFELLTAGKIAWPDLLITPPLRHLPGIDGVLFSGGVSEYIYGRERTAFGDLGPDLGREMRNQTVSRGFTMIESSGGIRATVIGASQYTVQPSGETIYIPNPAGLPLRNLRVVRVQVDWQSPIEERARMAVHRALQARDAEVLGEPFALAFSSPPFIGYGSIQELAHGVQRALVELKPDDRPRLLVFEQNVARVVGELLASEWNLPCVDEISLSELDFIDVGEVVSEEGFVPVVVKSLAFGA
jgi:ethanolamine utilization protein EutA